LDDLSFFGYRAFSPITFQSEKALYVYSWPQYGYFAQFPLNVTSPSVARFEPFAPLSKISYVETSQTGGFLSLSANGNTGGIIWAADSWYQDATYNLVPGYLHAYDANDIRNELWNSNIHGADSVGVFAKYVAPTVANGHVYLPTFSYAFNSEVNVYGLFKPTIIVQPVNAIYVNQIGGMITLSVRVTGLGPLSYQWFLGMTGDTSSPVSGANSQDFSTSITKASTFWVQVSNDLGSVDSSTSVITGALTTGSTGTTGTTGTTATTATTGSTGSTGTTGTTATTATTHSGSVILQFSFILLLVSLVLALL